MITLLLILIPIVAAIAIFLTAPARLTALGAAVANIALAIYAIISKASFSTQIMASPDIYLSLGFDNGGLSAVMLILSVIITLAAVLTGRAPEGREQLWYSSILLLAAGAIGAFISQDIFFFYAFHELALIPTFLMIGVLGRGERKEIAWKTTIYLAFGSIVLLAGLILAVKATGSFDMAALAPAAENQNAIALLLIIGFGTLVSLFPFHSWAAPAYASAPAPIAMLHAGVLKKFGLYGLIRIGLEVAPEGMKHWLMLLIFLLLGNIIWVGLVTINQKRLDTMLGNSSVMHMGYIFLAIAAYAAGGAPYAITAAAMLMFAHGISIAMSFCLADSIERHTGTLELGLLGGLGKKLSWLALLFGVVGMASIGLPGLANFAGEILVFFSGFAAWQAGQPLGPVQIATIIALWGIVISAVYMLRAYRQIFQGDISERVENVTETCRFERLPALLLGAVLLVVGIAPQTILQFFN